MKFLGYIFIILFAQTSLAQKDSVYSGSEQMPEYKGGNVEMMRFIHKNLGYPECPKGIVGCFKCYMSFVVSATGKLKDIKILKGIKDCPEIDAEALRVMNMMPDWIPAKRLGVTVDFKMNLPIIFTLK